MTMTPFQREGLHLLGYTKRESEFLFLVATHSGYFTNRQFKCFTQTESGSVSHAFIRKLLDRKRATYHAYRSGGRVYHLFARKVYQAMERENLPTRKKHQLDYVKTRLVALDFVLGHLQHRYLETEAEKLAFFEKELAVTRETLPVKLYRARRSADITPRYFVDRFPMFVDRCSALPLVTFTYVEAEAISLEAFTRICVPIFGCSMRFPSSNSSTWPQLPGCSRQRNRSFITGLTVQAIAPSPQAFWITFAYARPGKRRSVWRARMWFC